MIKSAHLKSLKKRMDWLEDRLEEKPDASYDKAELAALKWVVDYVGDEERNEIYRRVSRSAYSKGQINLLKFYKKTLKQAIHSGNIEAMQFMLDRTEEWLDAAKNRQDITDVADNNQE